MAKSILEEAIQDAKILKQTAVENAKNVLVEAMSGKIKEFVESQLGEASLEEDQFQEGVPMMVMLKPAPTAPAVGLAPEAAMYEKHEDEAEDAEFMKSLAAMGADEGGEEDAADDDDSSDDEEQEDDKDSDKEEDKEEIDEMSTQHVEGLELEAKDKEDDKDDKKVEEVVEITNEDLKAALSEVLSSLKTEATVTKGFGDAQDATIKASGGPGSMGIVDAKSGEHQWSEVTPPDAKDLTVKEAKAYITKLAKENQALKKENAEYKQAYGHLRSKLQEVSLFNSKLLHTHKLLNISELNDKQRVAVVEAFDRASNMREVELVYKSLSESFKIAGVLGESKQVKASKAKASRLSTPSSTVLKEALVKEEKQSGANDAASRWQLLAGLTD